MHLVLVSYLWRLSKQFDYEMTSYAFKGHQAKNQTKLIKEAKNFVTRTQFQMTLFEEKKITLKIILDLDSFILQTQ